jgi:hypothetical protein
MIRPRRLFALVALATALVACGVGSPLEAVPTRSVAPSTSPTPRATPSPSPVPSPSATPAPTTSPSPTTDPAIVLAADGIGPYVVGASLANLRARSLLTNVEPSFHCDDSWQGGEATGPYAGRLWVTFYLGRLIDVHTSSTELVTPSGARVGMTLAKLQNIYGSHGTLITGSDDSPAIENQALSVRVPDTDLGIVFYLDNANEKADAMSAGKVERLEQMAVVGEGC